MLRLLVNKMLAASAALLGLAHRLITELAAFTFCFMYITQNRYYGMWWLMIGGFWEIRDWQFPVGWSSEDYQLLSVVLYSFLGQVLSVLSSVFWLESQDHKKFFINSIWVKNKTKSPKGTWWSQTDLGHSIILDDECFNL